MSFFFFFFYIFLDIQEKFEQWPKMQFSLIIRLQSDICSENTEDMDHGWFLVVSEGDSPATCSVHSAAQISGSAAPALCSAISARSQPPQHSSLSWTRLWDDPHTLPWRHAAEHKSEAQLTYMQNYYLFPLASRCVLMSQFLLCLCFSLIVGLFFLFP